MHRQIAYLTIVLLLGGPLAADEAGLEEIRLAEGQINEKLARYVEGADIASAVAPWHGQEKEGTRESLEEAQVADSQIFSLMLQLFYHKDGEVIYQVGAMILLAGEVPTLLNLFGEAVTESGRPTGFPADAWETTPTGVSLLSTAQQIADALSRDGELPMASRETLEEGIPFEPAFQEFYGMAEETAEKFESFKQEIQDLDSDGFYLRVDDGMCTADTAEGTRKGLIPCALEMQDDGVLGFYLGRLLPFPE